MVVFNLLNRVSKSLREEIGDAVNFLSLSRNSPFISRLNWNAPKAVKVIYDQ
jgi:hypothetical protein